MNSTMEPAQIQPEPPIPPLAAVRTISGFWKRLLAFILDSLLLGLAGFVLGLFLFDFFAKLGGWGRLFGFCVTLLYFGLLNSSIGRGQTIGKRIMKIEVVDKDGNHISPARSFLRYTVLGAPFFLNNALIPPSIVVSPIGYIIGIIVFGFSGAIIYLYIFNRRTRQSLHDLAAGTFVANTLPKGQMQPGSVWRGHSVVVGVCFLAALAFCLISRSLSQKGVFPELLDVQGSIQSSGKVHGATVLVGKGWRITDGTRRETTFIRSNAFLKTRPDDYETAAREIGSIILRQYPDVMNKGMLIVTVTYGYDIGIARAWRGYSIWESPQQWRENLNKLNSLESEV